MDSTHEALYRDAYGYARETHALQPRDAAHFAKDFVNEYKTRNTLGDAFRQWSTVSEEDTLIKSVIPLSPTTTQKALRNGTGTNPVCLHPHTYTRGREYGLIEVRCKDCSAYGCYDPRYVDHFDLAPTVKPCCENCDRGE